MVINRQYDLAMADYEAVTKPPAERPGHFGEIKWTTDKEELDQQLKDQVAKLSQNFKESLESAQTIRRGREVLEPDESNPFARGWYELYNQMKQQKFYKEVRVVQARKKNGIAYTAKELVYITRDEMNRLAEVFDQLANAYKKLFKDNKSDLASLIRVTQATLAATLTEGVTFDKDKDFSKASLEELLGDIPFNTRALKESVEEIAEKTPADKEEWFEQMQRAAKNLRELQLKLKDKWIPIGGTPSDGKEPSPKDQFYFVEKAHLP
jgi:hypothetical protein